MHCLVSAGVIGAALMLGSVAMADPASQPAAQPVPAAPAAQATSQAAATSQSDANANMIICRERQAATGSRLGASRECHTKKEWDDRRAANQRTIDNAQQIGLTGNPPGN